MTWPVIWPDSANADELDPDVKARAEMLAISSLRSLTLYQVGGNEVTVMPCSTACRHPYSAAVQPFIGSPPPFHPVLTDSGAYANCFCGSGCSCDSLSVVELEGPVGRVDEVKIDGVVLDDANYRVDNGNLLVRTDGGTWPSCAGEKFTVTYLNSYAVDAAGQFAAGVLAEEFLKAMSSDKKCRLPMGVTSIARQGINIELTAGLFPDGSTGIAVVDAFVRQWNPNLLKTRPMVYSPDIRRPRQTTWKATP